MGGAARSLLQYAGDPPVGGSQDAGAAHREWKILETSRG
jgi:hypothetical protein